MSPVPHSNGTADGFFYKTNKASLIDAYIKDKKYEVPYPQGALHIEDGNALLRTLKGIPLTFGEITLKILDIMVPKRDFILSMDCYHSNSIKAMECIRRGCGPALIIDGHATCSPPDFSSFLTNPDNKTAFSQLIVKVWGSAVAASRLENTTLAIAAVDGKAFTFKSANGQVNYSTDRV